MSIYFYNKNIVSFCVSLGFTTTAKEFLCCFVKLGGGEGVLFSVKLMEEWDQEPYLVFGLAVGLLGWDLYGFLALFQALKEAFWDFPLDVNREFCGDERRIRLGCVHIFCAQGEFVLKGNLTQ
jgi:hypothetical protein